MKIERVHLKEAGLFGARAEETVPPLDVYRSPELLKKWSLEELASGDILVTLVSSERGQTTKMHRTRIPASNIKSICYASEEVPLASKKQP